MMSKLLPDTARCIPNCGVKGQRFMRNRGQQEMVGFVLIVVLVMVGMMVFLIISLRDSPESKGSLEVGNILDAVMKHTTDCAIVYEPDYDNFEDLFKSCHRGYQCINLNKSACDYLNESLSMIIDDLMASEADVSFYEIGFFVKDNTRWIGHENLRAGDGQQGLLQISEGKCTGSVNSAQRSIVSDSDSLIIQMKMCGVVSSSK